MALARDLRAFRQTGDILLLHSLFKDENWNKKLLTLDVSKDEELLAFIDHCSDEERLQIANVVFETNVYVEKKKIPEYEPRFI